MFLIAYEITKKYTALTSFCKSFLPIIGFWATQSVVLIINLKNKLGLRDSDYSKGQLSRRHDTVKPDIVLTSTHSTTRFSHNGSPVTQEFGAVKTKARLPHQDILVRGYTIPAEDRDIHPSSQFWGASGASTLNQKKQKASTKQPNHQRPATYLTGNLAMSNKTGSKHPLSVISALLWRGGSSKQKVNRSSLWNHWTT